MHHQSPTKSPEKAKKEFVYCVLVGVSLSSFADRPAYMRGEHPMVRMEWIF